MKISCNLLKKHLKNSDKIDFLEIWDTFSIRTAEVESLEIKGNDFEEVITARIVECENHPESEKLHILKVDTGEETIQIVCGAPNVRVGLISALVKVGGQIGDMRIGIRPLLGIESYGMMCSGRELGISDDHDGIIELPEDTPVGVDIHEVLPIKDIIVEIDNKSLSSRPDLWGHYGIAREISAITGHELLPLEITEIKKAEPLLKIKNNSPELCFRYIGTKIGNINNKISPMWLQIFLNYVGLRSINLVVDLTNYVMLELGQPMHAFDARTVLDIEIGLAKSGDHFATLDGTERVLSANDLMIKNGGNYFAIAGVMGGKDSGILDDTNSIVLESATFDATSVRRTAASLGLRTEASARYEKALDPNLAMDAVKRYLKLLADENSDLTLESAITDVYSKVLKEKEIILTKDLLYKYMGEIIADDRVIGILLALGFKVKNNKTNFKITVPTFRTTKDISIDVDIIEEIVRMSGYENIVPQALKMALTSDKKETIFDEEYEVKNYLATKYALSEVHTYLWDKTNFFKTLGLSFENVKLISKAEDNVLRTDLAISLLEVAQSNLKHDAEFGIFEIGTVINDNENKRRLVVLLTINGDDLKIAYQKIKEIVANIFKQLKNEKVIFQFGQAANYYNNDLTQNVIVNNHNLGQIKVFNRQISNKISHKKSFVVLDIDFDDYCNMPLSLALYEQISKYPATTLDYTLLVKRGVYYQEIEKILEKFKSPIILDRKLIDIYLDREVKKITIRYTVGSYDKTLTSSELEDFKKAFITFLQNNEISIILE